MLRVQISARRPAILTEDFLWFSSVLPDECRDSALKLGHDRFLPNPFQFLIHLSPCHSTLCTQLLKKCRKIKYTKKRLYRFALLLEKHARGQHPCGNQ
jgi:hypothetical protein